MKEFGIIGFPLTQSFSANFFNQKFADEHIEAIYCLYPINNISEFVSLCEIHRFAGLNVTIPYKEQVIPYLDALDDTAREIGAVNVIRFERGKRIGYNTDALGFMESFRTIPILPPTGTKALVLGTGGAAKAVTYALRKLGYAPTYVSRTTGKGYTYAELDNAIVKTHQIVVNCTPLGMYPATEQCADFSFDFLTQDHIVCDVIYNPEKTLFLARAEQQGAYIQNGKGMLYGQAMAAWRIWNDKIKSLS